MSTHIQESLLSLEQIRPDFPFEIGSRVVAWAEQQVVGTISQVPNGVDTVHIRQADGVPFVTLLERFRLPDGHIRQSGSYSIAPVAPEA